ncbi:MAG: MBOAT family protein [Lachnospiraceae bacterium]|nr:MBOAT family protein [Lachnospiraceae bacterium]
MVFSGITFLYYFLPVVLIVYLAVSMLRGRVGLELRNAVLLLASLFFYFWGEPVYLLLMLGVIGAVYGMGLILDRLIQTESRLRGPFFALSVAVTLIPLIVFKYADFLIRAVNSWFGVQVPLPGLALPVGISFYTFQILSYLIDLNWGRIRVQKRPDRLALYVSLFPQLIAGPIVRYAEVEKELKERETSLTRLSAGMERFVIGLAKKVLIANVLGDFCSVYRGSTEGGMLFAWLYAAAVSLQLYFDFSGYSDMAIGLGTMFGFTFPENFRYPFICRSITEFWRRWHMTLGGWFRDYVYIPMGGNRVSKLRWMGNLLVVWGLTGLWHGADWNFLLWGLYFGVLLTCEKLFWGKLLEKLPSVLRWMITIVLIMVSFLIFDSEGISGIGTNLKALVSGKAVTAESLYYLRSYGVLFAIAAAGATPVPAWCMKKIRSSAIGEQLVILARPVVLAGLLILCTAFLVDGSFNPFLYFRF